MTTTDGLCCACGGVLLGVGSGSGSLLQMALGVVVVVTVLWAARSRS